MRIPAATTDPGIPHEGHQLSRRPRSTLPLSFPGTFPRPVTGSLRWLRYVPVTGPQPPAPKNRIQNSGCLVWGLCGFTPSNKGPHTHTHYITHTHRHTHTHMHALQQVPETGGWRDALTNTTRHAFSRFTIHHCVLVSSSKRSKKQVQQNNVKPQGIVGLIKTMDSGLWT